MNDEVYAKVNKFQALVADSPSATIEEAVERLTATANGRIRQLTQQRDDLAHSLKEVLDAIDTCGFAACPDSFALMRTLARARTAMLKADILHRIEDGFEARQREKATP